LPSVRVGAEAFFGELVQDGQHSET
jgi:hypothetical protein